MSQQLRNAADEVDLAMRGLRESMRGIQIRRAGFKRYHDDLARAVATFTVSLVDAKALQEASKKKPRRR